MYLTSEQEQFLINNYQYMTHKELAERLNLPINVISYRITKLGLKKPKKQKPLYNIRSLYLSSKNESSTEMKIELILLNNRIPYSRNAKIKFNKKTYEIDFLLLNKLGIEVQGDYWHGNSKVYDFEDLSSQQIKRRILDIEKEEILNALGYKIIYIWEQDIINNIDACEEKILNFIS